MFNTSLSVSSFIVFHNVESMHFAVSAVVISCVFIFLCSNESHPMYAHKRYAYKNRVYHELFNSRQSERYINND